MLLTVIQKIQEFARSMREGTKIQSGGGVTEVI
jgi:hypothetical protein